MPFKTEASDAGIMTSSAPSSDFVRKLYSMLEDPSYAEVVKWTSDGGSFVVLENERFTKHILPKHFKHSNFASFVRQLNKYDFHKVRHNSDDGIGASNYGIGAWEFKHPDFRANDKDALDNIRRKAPSARKPLQQVEETAPLERLDMFSGQLIATQQLLQQMESRYHELSMQHSMVVQELMGVQKTVLNHEHVMQNVMVFLRTLDAKQRHDKDDPFYSNLKLNTQQQVSPISEDPSSPLQVASRLLNELNADEHLNRKTLEHLSHDINGRLAPFLSTPPPDGSMSASASQRGNTSASSSTVMPFAKLQPLADTDAIVYPIGQTNGIDPTFAGHVHNIPYGLPPKDADISDSRSAGGSGRKKSVTTQDPGWTRTPRILLVEDDPTCRRIGGKFLYSFQCSIDNAFDGLEAVNKMNAGSKYDLVLMDIIMPNLDGVSACHLIRQFDNTPIIAMTSNIRSDDISMYFQHGMNDVLPKPFTKEGLLNMLEKHLSHLKCFPQGLEMGVPNSANTISNTSMAQPSMPSSLKDENSPAPSPTTLGNWHSPTHFSPQSRHTAAMNAASQSFQPTQPSHFPLQDSSNPTLSHSSFAQANHSHHGSNSSSMSFVHSLPNFSQDGNTPAFHSAQSSVGGIPMPPFRRQLSDLTPDALISTGNNDHKRPRIFDQRNERLSLHHGAVG